MTMTQERCKEISAMTVTEYLELNKNERKDYLEYMVEKSNQHFVEYMAEKVQTERILPKYKIAEYSRKVAIYENAEKLLEFMNYPCVLVYRDYKGHLHVLESAQPFVDSFDFELTEE